MKQEAIARLQEKTAKKAIVEQLQHDFDVSSMMAKTLHEQMSGYFAEHYGRQSDSGQLTYVAVCAEEPAGRKLEECQRMPVTLTLNQSDDLTALRKGVAQLRQKRLLRMSEEAYDQGALLTHEDLACLLSSSLATIKRDAQALRRQGLLVPTRGQIKDIGKGVSHKTQIVQDHLAGYTLSEIERRRHHSINSIQRYCKDFVRIIRLNDKGFTLDEIHHATRLSKRLIQEYLVLYESLPADHDRLQVLLQDLDTVPAQVVEIKRGALLQ
jgi:biotin operon repressor